MIFRAQSFMQPVKVFVPPGHLDIVKLKTQSQNSPYYSPELTHAGSELIGNIALQPLELCLLLR